MWSFKFDNRILDVAISKDLIAFACENGWMHVFDKNTHLWGKKLISTYYRGPFTDVAVLSVDVNNELIAAGTDFADGKVYLFSGGGKKLWERQLISILGCWERPEDVVRVRIGENYLGGASEFLNSHFHLYTIHGERIFQIDVVGDVNSIEFWDSIIIGTDKTLYFVSYEGKLVRKDDINPRHVIASEKVVAVATPDRIVVYGDDKTWEFKLDKPLISLSDSVVGASKDNVYLFTLDGEATSKINVGDDVRAIYAGKNAIFAGTANKLVCLSNDGEIVDEIQIEGTIKIGEAGVLAADGQTVSFYPMDELLRR